MRDSHGDGIARSPKRNGTVLGQRGASGGGRGGVVVSLAVGLEEEESIVVVKSLTSDIGVHCAGSCLVLEGDIDGSHGVRVLRYERMG